MEKIKVIVLSGYGLNCEEETAFAFSLAGAKAKIIHINDLIAKSKMLSFFSNFGDPWRFFLW